MNQSPIKPMGLIYGITRQLYMKNNSYQSPANNGSVGVGLIGGREMSLHDRIMAKKLNLNECAEEREYFECLEYNCALNDSAKLAKEADELMAEMAKTISIMTRWIDEGGSNGQNEGINDICKMGEDSFEKYNAYKEQAK